VRTVANGSSLSSSITVQSQQVRSSGL